jgi:hypothetical protein
MEKAILIANQTGGMPVSVRDAREASEETQAARVIQLVSHVARPADDIIVARADLVSAADSVTLPDFQRPVVAGDAGGCLSGFNVWGAVDRVTIPVGMLWWGVVYDGNQTTVNIYPDDPSGGGVSAISTGTVYGRGGDVAIEEVDDSGINGYVLVAATVVTDDGDAANTLTFSGLYLDRVSLGDCGGRIGISLVVGDFTSFTSADITPLVLSGGVLLTRLETKRFERGTIDIVNAEGNLLLPLQWWEVQGVDEIALHITAIGGGGSVSPQIIKG